MLFSRQGQKGVGFIVVVNGLTSSRETLRGASGWRMSYKNSGIMGTEKKFKEKLTSFPPRFGFRRGIKMKDFRGKK